MKREEFLAVVGDYYTDHKNKPKVDTTFDRIEVAKSSPYSQKRNGV